MRRFIVLQGVAIGLLVGFGCARPKVWVPPRVELARYGTLGLVEFGAAPDAGPLATRRFLAALHGAQAGVPVVELGPLPGLLRSVGHERMGPDAARAIGERYGVDALVTGDLDLDAPHPSFSVQSFTRASADAEILGTLAARILDTRSGATVWSDEAQGKRTVAHLDVTAGREPRFGAVDPEGEEAKLVAWLVDRVTVDFRGYWTRP